MKRKLFTLLLAFLAIAGFQARAQGVVVTVATGDSLAANNSGTSLTNERGGYAGKLSTTPNHLTVNEKGEFVYTKGGAKSTLPTSDRITVSNPGGLNQVKFKQGDNDSLTLKYAGATYDRFVVFTSVPDPSGDYNSVDAAGAYNACSPVPSISQHVLTPQVFGNGEFEGYLAVQASGYVDDCNLLIVVHDKDGKLSLIAYKDYVANFNSSSVTDIKDKAKQVYPLYVKTSKLSARWATPADFVDCKFNSFLYNGEKLTAYPATETRKGETKTDYSVFTVTQVDYVKDADETQTNNIITHITGGAKFQGLDADFGGANPSNYGTATLGGVTDVIPLFTLATPEDNCQVLSVSRSNSLNGQLQHDGVYANKLEVRPYATYYSYDETESDPAKRYKLNDLTSGAHATQNDKNFDKYTSLQKFAIWIDIDGNFVLYPAASYSWFYGENKDEEPDNIQANSVLLYNDIHVRYIFGLDPDKAYGAQIGWWNGKGGTENVTPYIGTIPNNLQTTSNYEPRPFIADPQCETTDLAGRFYFLQVYPDTTDLGKITYPDVFGKGKYQNNREYVLSVQVQDGNKKRLVVVPKEEISSTEPEYWRFPYDSVNMAAHWEVKAVKSGATITGYRLINMLGDTLQYNVGNLTPSSDLVGGYLQYNSDWAGEKGAVPDSENYLGRPKDTGEASHWFPENSLRSDFTSTGTTRNVWKFNQLKSPYRFGKKSNGDPYNKKSFFLELTGHGLSAEIGLKFDGVRGWYNIPNFSVGAGINGRTYYQEDVVLDVKETSKITYSSYNGDNVPSCFGLLISLEEITYVPKYGPFYSGDKGEENSNGIYNTNDKDFLKQDSLTAYTFLEGFYDITEAGQVGNRLKLSAESVSLNDPLSPTRKVNVARLLNTNENRILEFIPLDSPTGNQRKDLIKSCGLLAGNNYGIDTLYGETYKWYLVKLDGKYLTFDTVNLAATTNREKVGLLFDATLENAMPVRLYQPLKGDKYENNFLFQFYLPKYTYYPARTLNKAEENDYPAIELLSTVIMPGGGEVCFATLSNESNYIYATKGRSGLTSGTRFHILSGQPGEGCCPAEFIDPAWMAANRLLSLPLNNQIWVRDRAVAAWIATGDIVDGGKSAIVTNEGADKATTLTHTHVTYIKPNLTGTFGSLTIPNGSTTPISGFQNDLEVPLYYVQNGDGKYLTVVPKSDMRDLSSTTPDVNGIKLEWRDGPLSYDKDAPYDARVLQLFAISGCKGIDANGWYGNNFIYLPLVSYQVNYATGAIVTNGSGNYEIFYNKNLGKKADPTSSNCAGNDVTACYRISQYTNVDKQVKDLVVFNSSTASGSGNLVPIEFRFQKQAFVKVSCDFQLVLNKSDNKYYTFDNAITLTDVWAQSNRIDAHWAIEWGIDGDDYLANFKPELTEMYGTPTVQNRLTGKYYFIDKKDLGDNSWEVKALDVSGYEKAVPDYRANFQTFILTCVEHTVPFFDLEKNGGLNIFAAKLAILEAPFVDRNLTYLVEGDNGATPPTPIWRNGEVIGYQSYIAKIGEEFNNAEYLTVYRENRRALTSEHIIPYYSFSITKDENGTDVEYFLNVDAKADRPGQAGSDSVYWSILTPTQREVLLDYENQPNALKNFKFCLPYKVKENGSKDAEVKYGATTYPPVYLQTLDAGKEDSPFLVISGSSTKYVTARRLDDAMKPGVTIPTQEWNIYTVDYSKIDPMKVTSWIFGGENPLDNVWVPLASAKDAPATTVEGVLTNQKLSGGGVTFVTESNTSPVNYGIMGTTNANNLRFEFEGDTTIGAWAVRPIWYYRIQFGNDVAKYLTDATGKTEAGYSYTFGGVSYPYGYFGEKLINKAAYVAENIYADADFKQTFGFRYVDPKEQSFYVISNANYTDPKNEAGYRFLASVNDHLVFVDDPKDAMIFQFGKKDGSGYTDLEVVGQGAIFGVTGGVKLLNTSGKVEIYSIDGRLIKSTVLTGSEEFITAPRGVVVVKNGSKVVKVVVR